MARLQYSTRLINGTTPNGFVLELQVRLLSNYEPNPKLRIYEDGSTPGPFLDTIDGFEFNAFRYKDFILSAADVEKTFVLEFQDTQAQGVLLKFNILTTGAVNPDYEGCIDYTTNYETRTLTSYDTQLSITNRIQPFDGGSESPYLLYGSIDNGVSFNGNLNGDGSFYSSWSSSTLEALGFIDEIPEVLQRLISCESVVFFEVSRLQVSYPGIGYSYTKTDASANGANDGTINVLVSGGSESFTFLWADGPTTQNRSGLAPGLYSVTITDTVTSDEIFIENILITEPQAPPVLPVIGTVLKSVPGNPIVFVPETLEEGTPQTLDNTLFCKQKHKGYQMGKYFNPYQKTDPLAFQFNSNFENQVLQMLSYRDGSLYNTYPLELKQENAGIATDYAIRIQNDTTPGRSRLYFQAGSLQVNSNIGDVFEIVNNVDGFNGVYAIVDIGDDYFVFTKNYAIVPAYSNATGRFISSTQDYNVYESTIDLLTVPNGKYYFKLTGASDNTMSLISEPINLQVEHEGTIGMTYRNIDNAFGTVWTTGFTGFLRIPSILFKRLPGGERSVVRSADYKLVKINAKKKRVVAWEIFYVPPYVIELLSIAADCDYFALNGIVFQAEEGMGEPEYIDRFYLANVVTNVEQVDWVSGYNGTDVGTVSSGFITTESGFLKR